MVGKNGGYYADAPVFVMTKDGKNEIRVDNIQPVEFEYNSATDETKTWDYFRGAVLSYVRGTCKWVNPEDKARILGYKNLNCLSRKIRRMKRKKEQERRKQLKEEKHAPD